MATCRSCGAEIRWAITETGERMPLDADPVGSVKAGLFTITVETVDGEERVEARSVRPARFYVSHFATCPNAETHRKR